MTKDTYEKAGSLIEQIAELKRVREKISDLRLNFEDEFPEESQLYRDSVYGNIDSRISELEEQFAKL